MRQLQVKRISKRASHVADPLPTDPRDADVVRAKERLYRQQRDDAARERSARSSG